MTTTAHPQLPGGISLYYKLPSILRRLVPPWYVVGSVALILATVQQDFILFELAAIFWYTAALGISMNYVPALSKALKFAPWIIGLTYLPFCIMVSTPVFAQATGGGECSGGGIFGGIVTFIGRTLQNLTLSSGGGSVAGYVCQLVSILVVSCLLGFIASAAYTAYAMQQGQTFVAIIQPLVAVLAFVVLSTIITTALIGSGAGGAYLEQGHPFAVLITPQLF